MNKTAETGQAATETMLDGSLSDRVRSLRLADRAAKSAGRPKGAAVAWCLCAVLLVTTLAFAYRTYRLAPSGGGDDAPRTTAAAPATPAASADPSVPASAGVASSNGLALQAKGYIIPAHKVQVSPKISGMIVWLNPRFEEGQHFVAPKPGEPIDPDKNLLAKLEDVDYRADRDHAKGALDSAVQRLAELTRSWEEEQEQAKAELDEQVANMAQLKLDADRSARLLRSSSLAEKDYEQAKFSYEAMERRVRRLRIAYDLMVKGPRVDRIRQAEGDVAQAKADLAKAQWKLDNCDITAPVSGTILTKKAEKGNLVIPSAFASDNGLSASLCDMADLSDLEVELKIQERDIANVVKGQKCTVMPEAYQNFAPFRKFHPAGYEGRVSRMMPNADRGQSAIPVRVKIAVPKDEEGVYLKPDMGVIVNFQKVDE
jgi:multidrug resistance efflux pump